MSAAFGPGIHASSAGGEPPPRALVGGKGYGLFRLVALAREGGFDVPPFVVLEPAAAAAFDRPQAIALATALVEAGIGPTVAVRSSAVDEDGAARSYAGQYVSYLHNPVDPARPAGILISVYGILESAKALHLIAYRERAGAPEPPRLAVVIQSMVDPVVSGVAFSADPLGIDPDTAVVNAVYGLGEGLVSGEFDADAWWVPADPAAPLEARIAEKPRAMRLAPEGAGGTVTVDVPPGDVSKPSLTPEEVRRIAAAARFLAARLGAPQDIEWALVGPERRLVLLQARPITALAAGERILWDNSNIVESYAGVTTTLTFAFARSAYETVYRQFCAVMGVPASTIEANAAVFANLLGLLRGRVYYHLRNWYRMLALLPGFAFNRGFMEKMMGVREPLDEMVAPPGAADRARDLLRLVSMVVRMIVAERRLDGQVPRFHARVGRELDPLADQDFAALAPGDIIAVYRRLERELLRQWKPPIVNDFFAMVFFGTLVRLTERWLPDEPPTLVNDLLCGEGGIISTEPARRLMELARRVTADPALGARFDATPDDAALWTELAGAPEAGAYFAELEAYRRAFGDRCMEELKLETVTLSEEPATILATVRAYRAAGLIDPAGAIEKERAIRRAAEARVATRLSGRRGLVHRWVLSRARRRVRDRENLRFERTRVFGVVRRVFLALGGHLAAGGVLDGPRDVFDLTPDEVFAHFEGAAAPADLRALAAQRRGLFARWAAAPAPPDRFETVGDPDAWLEKAGARASRAGGATPGADGLSGTGACPGIVRAPVRIVTDPRGVQGLAGNILVAERTDPGWTLLFPVAAGLLVERGSLLSHSAIVAREVGLPCIVGVRGLLAQLADGDVVEMDGTLGTVRIVARAAAAS